MDVVESMRRTLTEPIVERYMLEIKLYPNGQRFVRSWLVGKQVLSSKPKKLKKELKTEVSGEEVL